MAEANQAYLSEDSPARSILARWLAQRARNEEPTVSFSPAYMGRRVRRAPNGWAFSLRNPPAAAEARAAQPPEYTTMIGPLRKADRAIVRSFDPPSTLTPTIVERAKVGNILPPTIAAFNVFCWSPLSIGRFLQRALPWPHNCWGLFLKHPAKERGVGLAEPGAAPCC
jgi:hypothetical protein